MIKPKVAGVRQDPPLPVKVEAADPSQPELADRIRARVREALLVTAAIELVAAGSLPRSEYKSKLVDRP
jgi:phenylacetate-CoA ligase